MAVGRVGHSTEVLENIGNAIDCQVRSDLLAGALDRSRLRPFGERIVSSRLNEYGLPRGGIFGPLRTAAGFLRALSPRSRIVKTAYRAPGLSDDQLNERGQWRPRRLGNPRSGERRG
jgi:hypothetical protein